MLYRLRKYRNLVPIDLEYTLRRGACAVMPSTQSDIGALFHCCVHKTASQWMRLVISDPRFCNAIGLKPYFAPYMWLNFPERRKAIPDKSVIASFFTDKQTLLSLDKPDNWRCFFVTRDPRDLLISRYYSTRFSHRESGKLRGVREEMDGLSDDEGILWIIENRFDEVAHRLRSFTEPGPHDEWMTMVKFEDLTGPARLEAWGSMLDQLGIAMPEAVLAKVLSFYRFDRMRAPQSAGRKDEKYRHGKRGEWQDRFTPAIRDAFERRYGDLVYRLGYE